MAADTVRYALGTSGGDSSPTYLDRASVVNTLPNGDQRNQYSAVFDAFEHVYGRAPSQDELNQVLPAFQDPANPHITNTAGGNSLISQMHTATDNTPDKLYKRQQEEYLKNAPQHFDSVQGLFQDHLGRAATQDELNHFGSLLASGTTDQYQLGEFLKQQPEYTQRQDQQFQEGLSGKLQGYDKQYFSEQILPAIQQAYAKQGRSFDSSAFRGATAQAAQQQNTTRQNYLAQLSASQYGGRQQNAYNDYRDMVGNQSALTNAGINAQYQGIQNAQTRGQNIQDYNTQAQLYNQYLAKYGKRGTNWGSIGGGLLGAGLGAFGGPAGAAAGFSIGSSLGGAFDGGGGGGGGGGGYYPGLSSSWGGAKKDPMANVYGNV